LQSKHTGKPPDAQVCVRPAVNAFAHDPLGEGIDTAREKDDHHAGPTKPIEDAAELQWHLRTIGEASSTSAVRPALFCAA
jgi:hypothetical protein